MTAEDQLLRLRERLSRLRSMSLPGGATLTADAKRIQKQIEQLEAAPTLSGEQIWQSVELARHEDRPYTLDYIERIIDDWVELHGDRTRADDPALVAGVGRFNSRTVAVLGQQKCRDIKERKYRNFGMAHPEGYRKAMRVMELAERHRFPVLTLIDTPGAWPGVAAEQHGQGGTLARSHALMARLTVPIVACIIGEGGSGGASAIALADRVLMQEHAIYSVITPEGCAAILWRDASQAQKAAAAFKPDAAHCLELGVVDTKLYEPPGGAQNEHLPGGRLLADGNEANEQRHDDQAGGALRREQKPRVRVMCVFT